MSVTTEFKDFILRGNVVYVAVGVVMGASFGAVVTAFTHGVLTPLIGLPGKMSLADVKYTIHGSTFLVGDFLNAAISFLLTAFAIFFLVVKPVNHLASLRKVEAPVEETTKDCPRCLSKVPVKATRCAFCTSDLGA